MEIGIKMHFALLVGLRFAMLSGGTPTTPACISSNKTVAPFHGSSGSLQTLVEGLVHSFSMEDMMGTSTTATTYQQAPSGGAVNLPLLMDDINDIMDTKVLPSSPGGHLAQTVTKATMHALQLPDEPSKHSLAVTKPSRRDIAAKNKPDPVAAVAVAARDASDPADQDASGQIDSSALGFVLLVPAFAVFFCICFVCHQIHKRRPTWFPKVASYWPRRLRLARRKPNDIGAMHGACIDFHRDPEAPWRPPSASPYAPAAVPEARLAPREAVEAPPRSTQAQRIAPCDTAFA